MADYATPQDFNPAAGAGGDDTPAVQAAINTGYAYLPWTASGYHLLGRLIVNSGNVVQGSRKKPSLVMLGPDLMFDVRGSDIVIESLRPVFTEPRVLMLMRTDLSDMERVTFRDLLVHGAYNLVLDLDGPYRSVLLKMSDILGYGTAQAGIDLRRAFAYLYATRISVFQVPTANVPAVNVIGNEGAFWTECDATNGTVNTSNTGNHGFAFTNCKANWISACMADMVGGDGVKMEGCEYMYLDRVISSMVGGRGVAALNSGKVTLSSCNVGGRAGMSYAPSQPGIYANNSPKIILDDGCRVYSATGTPVSIVNSAGSRNNAMVA